MNQYQRATYIDSLLVLGGEDPDENTRSKHSLNILSSLSSQQKKEMPIITTGLVGLHNPAPEVSHARQIANYLSDRTDLDVIVEEESRDTYANMVFSAPILNDLKVQNVGLVTDGFHMPRALIFARKVLKQNIIALPTKYNPISKKPQELIAKYSLLADLKYNDVKDQDLSAHQNFIQTVHPLHAENPKPSFYATALKGYEQLQSVGSFFHENFSAFNIDYRNPQ